MCRSSFEVDRTSSLRSQSPDRSVLGLAFLLVGLFAYSLYGLAQVAIFVQQEARVSGAAAGLHASAFALGLVISGLTSTRLAKRIGTRAVVWGGAVAMAGAAAAIAIGPPILVLTVSAAFVEGIGGGSVLAAVNELLVYRFERRAAAALSAANVAASLASLAGPVIVAGLSTFGYGWRPMLLLPILAVGIGFAFFGRLDMAADAPSQDAVPVHLGTVFWSRWLVLVLVIGIEFSTVFSVAPLLQRRYGLDTAASAGMLGWLIGGMLFGRIGGIQLSNWRALHGQLLLAGLVFAMIGALTVWVSPTIPMGIAGLVLAGAGIGTLYPEAVAAAVRSVPGSERAASARCSVGFGIALLVAPVLLGATADATDAVTTFAFVPLLIGCTTGLGIAAAGLGRS